MYEYLRYSDNKIYSFLAELTEEEWDDFQAGSHLGTLVGDYYDSPYEYFVPSTNWFHGFEFALTEIEYDDLQSGVLFGVFARKATVNAPTGYDNPILDNEHYHTTGSTCNIGYDVRVVYINPAIALPSLEIVLPENPINGYEIKISFGGTITSGSVANSLTISGNSGQTILGGSSITTASAGDGYIFKFQANINLWRIF